MAGRCDDNYRPDRARSWYTTTTAATTTATAQTLVHLSFSLSMGYHAKSRISPFHSHTHAHLLSLNHSRTHAHLLSLNHSRTHAHLLSLNHSRTHTAHIHPSTQASLPILASRKRKRRTRWWHSTRLWGGCSTGWSEWAASRTVEPASSLSLFLPSKTSVGDQGERRGLSFDPS
jgi:hypothetical protein